MNTVLKTALGRWHMEVGPLKLFLVFGFLYLENSKGKTGKFVKSLCLSPCHECDFTKYQQSQNSSQTLVHELVCAHLYSHPLMKLQEFLLSIVYITRVLHMYRPIVERFFEILKKQTVLFSPSSMLFSHLNKRERKGEDHPSFFATPERCSLL